MEIPPYIHNLPKLDDHTTQTIIDSLPEPSSYEGDHYTVILNFPEVEILSKSTTLPNKQNKDIHIALFYKASTINGKIWILDNIGYM